MKISIYTTDGVTVGLDLDKYTSYTINEATNNEYKLSLMSESHESFGPLRISLIERNKFVSGWNTSGARTLLKD